MEHRQRLVLVQTSVIANARKGDIVTWQELGFSSEDKLDDFIAAGYGTEIFDAPFDPEAGSDDRTPPPSPPVTTTETLEGRRGSGHGEPR